MIEIEFDPAKNRKNIQERRLPFTLAAEFDWTTALIAASDRRGESRFFAIGYIGNRLHAPVFNKKPHGGPRHKPAPRQQEGGKAL